MIRYRTEAFSGSGERNIVDVMRFETFELGNTDILETLQDDVLEGNPICRKFGHVIDFLQGENEDPPYESICEQRIFFQSIVSEISKVTGYDLKYALWLADKDTVTDKTFYGKDMVDNNDFDSYETGPVVLSELGYEGTLFGYVNFPVCLEKQLEHLQDELTDILHEREKESRSLDHTAQLDKRYLNVNTRIQEIKRMLFQNENTERSEIKDSLENQICSAELRSIAVNQASHDRMLNREPEK